MLTKIAPQFWKVLYKWTPLEAKLLHGLKNLFQALEGMRKIYKVDVSLGDMCLNDTFISFSLILLQQFHLKVCW
jgi:hypothetical protein